MPDASLVRGLARACHPLPTLAVTAISAGLALLAGVSLGSGVLLVLAVLTGQLSIGWSNDWIDAARDRLVQRAGKPVAAGEVSERAVAAAAVLAVIATVAASAWLGWRPGAAALTVVVCGWAYNLGLKATVLSFMPYAVAFGVLPAVATLAAAPPRWPAAWALAAGALLGVAAHFANVFPTLRRTPRPGCGAFHTGSARGGGRRGSLVAVRRDRCHRLRAGRFRIRAGVAVVATGPDRRGRRRGRRRRAAPPVQQARVRRRDRRAAADIALFAASGGALT